ncbi:SAV_915 family protein [Streptomyces sp. MNP-20]|uniref:SAV_915 family protein n=1 Tax=Streptomyces sp. MNP-20 TaxID=2721165 RepID=UPI0020A6A508|nr:SAV_915 family protein [Streptomyces sp. MNP-20]
MAELLCGDDPEPSDRFPAGPLYVPVRPGSFGCATRLFRTPLGDRTAVGFTSVRQLTATLGGGQPWIRLDEATLRAVTEPLGAATVTVDPQLTAPAPTREEQPAPVRTPRGSGREPEDDEDSWPNGGGHCRASLSYRLG